MQLSEWDQINWTELNWSELLLSVLTDDEFLEVVSEVNVEELKETFVGEHVHQHDDHADNHAADS